MVNKNLRKQDFDKKYKSAIQGIITRKVRFNDSEEIQVEAEPIKENELIKIEAKQKNLQVTMVVTFEDISNEIRMQDLVKGVTGILQENLVGKIVKKKIKKKGKK